MRKIFCFDLFKEMVLASVPSFNATPAARLAGHTWPKVRSIIPVCVVKSQTRIFQVSHTQVSAYLLLQATEATRSLVRSPGRHFCD